jgi:P4 family phage/plasmid primase-like protien
MAVNNNNDDFYKYLRQFSIKRGQPYTHTSISKRGSNTGMSLNIPTEKLDEFFEKYTRALMRGVPLHLTEKPINPSRMRIDLDFRFMPPENLKEASDDTSSVDSISVNSKKTDDDNDGKIIPRMYTIQHIERILRVYFSILSEFLNLPDDAFVAYIMEKPEPILDNGKIKDGIHVIWPDIVVSNNFQHMVRRKILEDASVIFEGLKVCNTYENIVDEAIIDKNNWQIYGSRKPDRKAYSVTYVYKYNKYTGALSLLANPTPKEEMELVKRFSMRVELESCLFYTEKEKEFNDYVQHIIPTMDEKRKAKIDSQIFGNSINPARAVLENTDERELAKRLVMECLSHQRADNYEDWIKLGWALRNIDYNLLDTWIEFSRLSAKYMEGECQRCWDRMCTDALGMGTLRWWARKDNPQQYEHIINGNVLTLIDKCAGSKGAPYDVAEVVYTLYKDRFMHTTKDQWFAYKPDKHRWERTNKGIILKNVLSRKVCQKFMERANYWNLELVRGDHTNPEAAEKSAQLKNIANKLKITAYKSNVMTECECFFTDEKFEDILDSRPYLIGFENGVYDLRMHEFRDGLPDDYITYSTKRYYIPFNAKSEEAQEIEKFMSRIFTNQVIYKYVKDIFSSFLDGSIRQEKFYIFNGAGCHAKDTLIMKYDGSFEKVQDIQVGDVLMGDDSTPRNVLELFRGSDDMYRIIPNKGDPFVVNGNHILSVKFTNLKTIIKRTDGYYKKNSGYRAVWYEYNDDITKEPIRKSLMFGKNEDAKLFLENMENTKVVRKGDVLDIKVCELLKWDSWWIEKSNVSLYKAKGIHFNEKDIKMDPYMLGVWLGDGDSHNPKITTMDAEIVKYFQDKLPLNHSFNKLVTKGKASDYSISFSGKEKGKGINKIRNALREYNVLKNKHIPDDYKHNSREVRMKLLAGIIDTDGHYQKSANQYELIQKNERLMDDIVYLVRSLGFACYKKQIQKTCTNGKNGPVTGIYYRMQIYGDGIEQIPCLLPRKKAESRRKNRDALLDGFKIEALEKGDYYGFELDANHRYLVEDFTVHHNSNGKSLILSFLQKAIGDYYCILPIALLTQKRTQSNSAQAELERTKGRRLTVMQEPGDGEKLNIGLMKELTGGDRILTRGLFKDPIEFKPQFKMVMTCNELPEVSSDDGGTWRRIRVIEFTSRFTDKPNPNKPNEFKADPELMDKFEKWTDTFVSMLIDHHKHSDLTNIFEPVEVTKSTELYRYTNDSIGQFVHERMILDDTSTERVLLTKIYAEFKAWANQTLNKNKKIPDRNQFLTYMEKVFGQYPRDNR